MPLAICGVRFRVDGIKVRVRVKVRVKVRVRPWGRVATRNLYFLPALPLCIIHMHGVEPIARLPNTSNQKARRLGL